MSHGTGELVTEALDYDGGRQVTVYVPPVDAEAIVYLADGGWHTERLSQALESARISSTMLVGVHGLQDDEGRLGEYVPGFDDERFRSHESFFIGEVSRWVASRFGVALPAERTGVWGASLGGEFALGLGLRFPHIYGAAFVASPGAGYQPPAELPSMLARFYLVGGTQEPFFLGNAQRWTAALRDTDADADVVMVERDGAHGDAFWAEEFPLMVAWAFGP